MAQERWDIEVLFLNGPLSKQGPMWFQGPVVRIGKQPGVSGMSLRSYQGVATVHATIQAYSGAQITLSGIEPHEVRVANHERVNWAQVRPLRKGVYLNQGDVVHIGALDKGCRFKFLRAKTFEWRQTHMLSNTDQSQDQLIYNQIETTRINPSTIPPWFIQSLLAILFVSLGGVAVIAIDWLKPEHPISGAQYVGYNHYDYATLKDDVEPVLLSGFQSPFSDFVMSHNAEASGYDDIRDDVELWDKAFYRLTVSQVKRTASYKGFWKRLDEIRADYSYVVSMLRQSDLPEVLAGIPFQESKYDNTLQSPVCANGIWQFMPETGKRMGLDIRKCRFKGSSKPVFTPTDLAPPYRSINAKYIEKTGDGSPLCRITSCSTDERTDLELSTEAAIKLLEETWSDDELSASGSLVQATILAHNAGYNDKPYLGKTKKTNILPAYRAYMKKKKTDYGTTFYGDNITCVGDKKLDKIKNAGDRCGGFIPNQSQPYGYLVVAQHILAVCYYAKNYANDQAFSKWEKYTTEQGYCSLINVPTSAEAKGYK
ncbi:MAG: hypothetical protein CMK59_02425 [Proteobacteria bacterium]|nr:hypothetical protein [Pseudomonadota bacterium]